MMGEINFNPLLKISNSTELKKFLHECVDDLTEKNKMNFNTSNSEFVEFTKDDFEEMKRNIQSFYRNCFIDDSLKARLDGEDERIPESVKSCFEVRKNDIIQYLAKTYLLKNGNTLIDSIDWRLRWVLGTSDLTALKEPYLQVDLNGAQQCEETVRKTSLSFEANLQQVEQIIKELTMVKKELSES